MKERPIIFTGEMVRAILDGRKTQTRRVVKFKEPPDHWQYVQPMHGTSPDGIRFGDWRQWRIVGEDYPDDKRDDVWCPFGEVGNQLWVREAWCHVEGRFYYRADQSIEDLQDEKRIREACPNLAKAFPDARWKPSIHMARGACRLLLKIRDIRVEQLQNISESDAVAEGVDAVSMVDVPRQATWSRRHDFVQLWNSINLKRALGWHVNPWVWVVSFERA